MIVLSSDVGRGLAQRSRVSMEIWTECDLPQREDVSMT